MGKSVAILIAILIGCNVNCFAQGKVTRQKKETTETRQTVSKQKQEEESKRKIEEEAKRKQEEEVQSQQEEEAKRQQEEEAKRKQVTGTINGHEWVDLGLPSGLKWATCNVTCNVVTIAPENYGDYFAWGETKAKSSYTDDNSLTYNKSVSTLQSKGIINSAGNLTRNYDAATYNWGGSWRLPTKTEYDELIKNCTWTWTTQSGKNGYKVTGPNGKSIFLPAAGHCDGTSLDYAGEYGYYWSSSVYDGSNNAYRLDFDRFGHNTDWYGRDRGRSVRPVSE